MEKHQEPKVRLHIKAQANTSKDEIVGYLGNALKIRVKAVPDKGMANKSIQALLAQKLNLTKAAIQLISGHNQAHKVFEISGINEQKLSQLLEL
jgi:uncharacterized protein (TIGR00251 family)